LIQPRANDRGTGRNGNIEQAVVSISTTADSKLLTCCRHSFGLPQDEATNLVLVFYHLAYERRKMSDTPKHNEDAEAATPSDFIRRAITEDLEAGRYNHVQTRWPPEPNGYIHIGHAKAININFRIADEFGGKCNLRFDDTNPTKEEMEFAISIQEDIRWLGFDWEDRLYFASDYFEQLYEMAVKLIKKGVAYVDHLSADEIRDYRGTLTVAGKNSPYRERPIDENLDLFQRMKNGEFPDGTCVLRAKIDMASPNTNMRDPVLYRIVHAEHYRTGNEWCIFPTYDFQHGQSDSIEGVTHSLCTLEFENHRPLYDWFVEELGNHHGRQIEFAPLDITYMITSKRFLRRLVEENYVSGWDDPRMPTLRGLRRRGYAPEAILEFMDQVGVAKSNSTVDIKMLEHHVRQNLNKTSNRVMAVLNPLKLIITNYPEGQSEEMEAINNPEDPDSGTRKVPFSRVLYIERDDFMEDPPKKFFRLAPGREVRLRYAYYVKCEDVIKDKDGNIIELHCTYDPATKGGYAPDGRKVKATLHWASADHALKAEVRQYNYLFTKENPHEVEEGEDLTANLNHDSLKVLEECYVEPSLSGAEAGNRYQFERLGYFCVDPDSTDEKLVFNQTVTLRDQWAKIQKKGKKK
jgi:glutaminyl-tRNA synthetase